MVQDPYVLADEQAIESMSREDRDLEESLRDEQRRTWCVATAVNLAISLQRAAPNAQTLDVMLCAEEMNDFIETGVARNAKVSRKKQ